MLEVEAIYKGSDIKYHLMFCSGEKFVGKDVSRDSISFVLVN